MGANEHPGRAGRVSQGTVAQYVVLPQGPLPGSAPGFNALLIGVWHLRGIAMTFLVFHFLAVGSFRQGVTLGGGFVFSGGCRLIPSR